MHILLETLLSLTASTTDEFDDQLKQVEETAKNIDFNSIPQQDFAELFHVLTKQIEKDVGAEASLRVLNYIIDVDILLEEKFDAYIQTIFGVIKKNREDVFGRTIEATRHVDAILERYKKRLETPEKYPEYLTGFVTSMQESAINFYFSLQDVEQEREKNDEVKVGDQTTPFGAPRYTDTRDSYLKHLRQIMEILDEGTLGANMFDFGYVCKVSPENPELEIIGRYNRPCSEQGCSCGK